MERNEANPSLRGSNPIPLSTERSQFLAVRNEANSWPRGTKPIPGRAERSQFLAVRNEANSWPRGTKPIGRVPPCNGDFRSNFLTILDVTAEEKRVANPCAPPVET